MSDLLSQDEIDALLHGVDEVEEEDIHDGEDGEGSTLQYDFSSQDRIVRGLSLIHISEPTRPY